jgi:hypothetical protein
MVQNMRTVGALVLGDIPVYVIFIKNEFKKQDMIWKRWVWGLLCIGLVLAGCGETGVNQKNSPVAPGENYKIGPPAPARDVVLDVLKANTDFQEYERSYPGYSITSRELLTPASMQAKRDALIGGPHEALAKTYDNLTEEHELWEVRATSPGTKDELVTIVDATSGSVSRIYLNMKVDSGNLLG